jgi:hypothetical protein
MKETKQRSCMEDLGSSIHNFCPYGLRWLNSPHLLDFGKVSFWIHTYHLPLNCMNREVGRLIGLTVGEVEDIDVVGDGVGWRKILRIWVVIDVDQPLARGRMIQLKGKEIHVGFQYEKLPRFCFGCGTIRHGVGGCKREGSRRNHHLSRVY